MLTREQIATRAARELREGDTVVLDEGLGRVVASHLPKGVELVEARGPAREQDLEARGSAREQADAEPGAGRVVDVAVLTAIEVAKNGEFSASAPARAAKKVIALLERHRGEDGAPRVRAECASPAGKANLVITDLAVFEVTPEGLVLREVAPGVSALDVQLASEPPLLASDELKVIEG